MDTRAFLQAMKDRGIGVVDALQRTFLTESKRDVQRRERHRGVMFLPSAPWAKALRVKAVLARQKERRLRRTAARIRHGRNRHGQTVREPEYP